MATVLVTTLVDALRQYHLLEPSQLDEVIRTLKDRCPEPKSLARELLQRGWLTAYQANQLLQGHGHELLLGSYVMIERIGEGGMGQVFKARNWKLGRIVALKLIRKERLANPDAVRRFQREVRAAAALQHPNIVRALDADEIGGTHLLVMEYVEGAVDLAALVHKQGPLPVAQACEYIRQAALGLQHAAERGLVHRDIKPHNLLLAAGGQVVKILDMGLARLERPADGDDRSSTMTREGMVMGTVDYLAPEQANNSHSVDIRADLYSLGCTFYFLLVGRPPFQGGEMVQKLLQHQLHEPPRVEKLRADVPAAVGSIVRKLMAKRPPDRYQTPAEAAAALAAFAGGGNDACATAPATDRTPADESRTAEVMTEDTMGSALAYMAKGGDARPAVVAPPPSRVNGRLLRQLLFAIAAGVLLLLGCIALTVWVWNRTAATKLPESQERWVIPAPKKPPVPASIDLLKLIDPAKNAVDSPWHFDGAALVSPTTGNARLQIPYSPGPEYDLTVRLQRESGTQDFCLGLMFGGKQALVHFDWPMSGWIAGLSRIDGAEQNQTTLTSAQLLLIPRKPMEIICQVRRNGIAATLDGKSIISWKGDADRLSLAERWRVPDQKALFLLSDSVFRISVLELTPVGAGQVRQVTNLLLVRSSHVIIGDGSRLAAAAFHRSIRHAQPFPATLHAPDRLFWLVGHADALVRTGPGRRQRRRRWRRRQGRQGRLRRRQSQGQKGRRLQQHGAGGGGDHPAGGAAAGADRRGRLLAHPHCRFPQRSA